VEELRVTNIAREKKKKKKKKKAVQEPEITLSAKLSALSCPT
jgi:hypothetical protein